MRHALFRSISKNRKRSSPTGTGVADATSATEILLPNRRIKFNPKITVSEVLHLTDYTPEEVEACWYSGFERNEMREECKFVISLHQKTSSDGSYLAESKYPRRGLEQWIEAWNPMTQKQSIRTVIQEQESMSTLKVNVNGKRAPKGFRLNLSREDVLAKVYSQFTQGPKVKAFICGVNDQKAAASIYLPIEGKDVLLDPLAQLSPKPTSNLPSVTLVLRAL